jgi:phage gp36-like protein
MATYATEDQMRIRLKDQIKREIDSTTISEGINWASALIDGYLAAFYDITEFTASVPLINAICKNLAAAFISGTLFQDYDQSASTWESKQYNWCIEQLRAIQDGLVIVPGITRKGI